MKKSKTQMQMKKKRATSKFKAKYFKVCFTGWYSRFKVTTNGQIEKMKQVNLSRRNKFRFNNNESDTE